MEWIWNKSVGLKINHYYFTFFFLSKKDTKKYLRFILSNMYSDKFEELFLRQISYDVILIPPSPNYEIGVKEFIYPEISGVSFPEWSLDIAKKSRLNNVIKTRHFSFSFSLSLGSAFHCVDFISRLHLVSPSSFLIKIIAVLTVHCNERELFSRQLKFQD